MSDPDPDFLDGRIRVISIRVHNPAIEAERGEQQKE